jgi:hypothetical protein
MARHLIIGDGTAFGLTAGLVNDGAVSVQKMTQNGPTELVLGDTMANAPQIRILAGGTAGKNIATPWFYGRDVVNYSGKANVAAVAHRVDGTLTTNTAAISVVTTKIYRTDVDSHDSFSFDTGNIAAATSPTAVQVIVLAAWNAIAAADKPDWLNATAAVSAGAFRVTASKRGDATNSGGTWEEFNPIIRMIQTHSVDTAQTFADAVGVAMLPGYGDGFAVKAFEESLMGAQYGYYNRIAQPITPASQAVTGTAYDMYVIAATKDGSSASQINGVDNLIEINVALVAGDADSLVVENKLNAYFAGSFANVIL